MIGGALLRPGMRTYFIPLVAGLLLAASAFLPWVFIGELALRGVPDVAALWIAGLGLLAAALAFLSLITRKNSRHPLLIVGLVSLGIMFLSWRIMPKSVHARALTRAQAIAIVDSLPEVARPPAVLVGSGIYLGLASSAVLVCFGLTIVIRRAQSYAPSDPDDDV